MLEYTTLWSPTNFLGKEIKTEDGAHVSDSFSPPSTFFYKRGMFESALDVAGRLNDWNNRFSNYMITHAVPRDPTATSGPRQKHLFKRRPQSIAFYDLENIPYLDATRHDLIADPEGTIRKQLFHLSPILEEVEWSFVLSSKAGLADDFRGHLYIQLDAIYEPEAITEWIKEQNSPFTDLSVYDDGHAIIVESPRIIGMDDPFSKRAFSNRGAAMQPRVADYSGHVRGTVLRQRTSNRLPVLGDIILSGEHITDEVVKKYLPRLRGAIGKVDWDDARPYLEAELHRLDAPPNVYKRLKGDTAKYKGQPLGVARRGWESLSGGDQEDTLMLPRFIEPAGDVNTEQKRLKRAVKMVVGDGGTHLFRASLGMGKTEAAVAQAVKESMLGDPVVMAVPSHERANELCARLNGELTRQVDDYTDTHGQFSLMGPQLNNWAAWRGREQDGMCERVPAVKAAQSAGVSVHDALCGFGQDRKCPKFDSCPYAHQVEHFYENNWVVPHAMLEHSSRLSKDAGTIMADESFVHNLKGNVKVELAELIARDSDLHDIYEILLERTKNTQVNEITPIDKQRLEDALAIELEARVIPEVDTDWEDVEIETVCGEATEMYRSRVVSLLRALIAEHDGGRNHVYCYKSNEGPTALVAYRKHPKFITEKHTLIMFDATPNEMAVRKFFPEVEIEDFVAPNQNLVVIQVGDRTGQVAEFIAKNTKPKEVARAKRNRERLAQWAHAQPGDGLCSSRKPLKSR